MTYKSEDYLRHLSVVESVMADYSEAQRGQVLAEFKRTWPDDKEAEEIIKSHKDEIAKEATPEECEEVFRNIRL